MSIDRISRISVMVKGLIMHTWKYIILACITIGHISHIHTMKRKLNVVENGNRTKKLPKNTSEVTQIFDAVKRGDYQETERLLSNNPNLAYARDNFGGTPLHVASFEGHTPIVQLLIDNNANPNAVDYNQRTPLHIAAIEDQIQTAQLLIKKGGTTIVKALDADQETPLHFAAEYGNVITSWWLIALGADWKAHDTDGNTPQMVRIQSLFTKEPEKTRILFDEIVPKIKKHNPEKISEYADFLRAYAQQDDHPFLPHYPVMAALGQWRFDMARELMHRLNTNNLIDNDAIIDMCMLKGLTQRQSQAKTQKKCVKQKWCDEQKLSALQNIIDTTFPENVNVLINRLKHRNLVSSLHDIIHTEIQTQQQKIRRKIQQQANLWQQVANQNHLCDIKFKIQE